MKILSIRDPWATLIARGVKDVENRGWSTKYRGPVAVHVSRTYDKAAHYDPVAAAAFVDDDRVRGLRTADMPAGVILAVVDLVDAHRHTTATGCGDTNDRAHFRAELCSLWGQPNAVHLVLQNPRLLSTPIPYTGSLGLRELSPAITAEVEGRLS